LLAPGSGSAFCCLPLSLNRDDFRVDQRQPIGESASGLSQLSGLPGLDHGKLNLIGKAGEVDSQPVKEFALCMVCGQIADQPAFGCVSPKLFQMALIILRGALLSTRGRRERNRAFSSQMKATILAVVMGWCVLQCRENSPQVHTTRIKRLRFRWWD
jgi:hypothetical protein